MQELPRVRAPGPAGRALQDLQNYFYAEAHPEEFAMWVAGVPSGNGPALCEDSMVNRTDRLRMCGNGVVPLQAAVAFVLLARRAVSS